MGLGSLVLGSLVGLRDMGFRFLDLGFCGVGILVVWKGLVQGGCLKNVQFLGFSDLWEVLRGSEQLSLWLPCGYTSN